jgi:hypothetical protein
MTCFSDLLRIFQGVDGQATYPPRLPPDFIAEIVQFRERSVANGWRVVVLHNPWSPSAVASGSGGKMPRGKGWQNGTPEYDQPAMRGWRSVTGWTTNTGIYTGHAGRMCAAVDLDIDDQGIGSAVLDIMARHLPRWLIRRYRGNSNKVLFPFRCDSDDIRKMSAVGYGPAGERRGVEILGSGQQFVAHGIHPSMVLIEWENGSPAGLTLGDLPNVPQRQFAQFIEAVRASGLLGNPVDPTKSSSPRSGHVGRNGGSAQFDGVRSRMHSALARRQWRIADAVRETMSGTSDGEKHNAIVYLTGFLRGQLWTKRAVVELLEPLACAWDGSDWTAEVERAFTHADQRQTLAFQSALRAIGPVPTSSPPFANGLGSLQNGDGGDGGDGGQVQTLGPTRTTVIP